MESQQPQEESVRHISPEVIPEIIVEQKANYLIPISIVIAGALIAGGIYLSGMRFNTNQQSTNNDPTPQTTDIRPVSKDDHIIGNLNAKVVIVEYSDLECPFCKAFHVTLHKVFDKYGKNGDVAWVYRHFPLSELHSKAPHEAEASECAFEQGGNDKFWQFIDQVYSVTPSNNGLESNKLPEIAKQIGLDVNKFNSCLASGKYKDKVASQRTDAINAGGKGTPFTVLVTSKGKLPITQGAISYESLSGIIDQMLEDLKK